MNTDHEDPAPLGVTLDKLVRVYLKIRDARAEKTKEYESEDRALKEAQETIQAGLLAHMNETGMKSFKTRHGTVYTSVDVQPTAQDWDAFYAYVAETNSFEALHKRISKEFVSTYMEQHDGDAPPGVSVIRKNVVNVRRKN
jgi:hypothetical protein